ncbi:Rlp7p [Ascoidea rubescens DSM 1968]|uniref:Ribosomal protein L30p/L7e n=1 Tax=Ascoidea rubescens DSM 1968 TaxID=1344418 RepID=A0A1D2VR07_9ASCO|nr:ribosomal protein L30p/L7e [Ascoidea rubescens DSM 1968]ODV64041.1 ribosomal protein L30p/L7e [Ascoidea rubescens DSM 1968]
MSQQPDLFSNSNPEILLKKRKNATELRFQKQTLAKQRLQKQKSQKRIEKKKFIRAETLIAKHQETQKENKRLARLVKKTLAAQKKTISNKNNGFQKILTKTVDINNNTEEDNEEEEQEQEQDNILSEKIEVYNGEPRLLFVIKVTPPHNTNVQVPYKARQILQALRLKHSNLGVFVKLSPLVLNLLKLIAPYIVVGEPNLITVRQLIQKRAAIKKSYIKPDSPANHNNNANNNHNNNDIHIKLDDNEVILNDNQIVEDNLGQYGIICVEDIIHEISSLRTNDNFKKINQFLNPFKLNPPVNGWGPISKLKRIELKNDKIKNKISNSDDVPLIQIDINKYIQNYV